MTPEEMVKMARNFWGQSSYALQRGDKTEGEVRCAIGHIWNAAAEICTRLDAIAGRGEEKDGD
jgi:hypothetical protein